MPSNNKIEIVLGLNSKDFQTGVAESQRAMVAGFRGMSVAAVKEMSQINQSLANIKSLEGMTARGAEAGQTLTRLKTEAERLGNAWRSSKLELDRMPAAVEAVKKSISDLNAVPKKKLTAEQAKELADLKDRLKDLSSQQQDLRLQTNALANDYRRASDAVQRTTRTVAENAVAVDGLRGRLKLAGVDTGNLAAEQAKLQVALTNTTAKAKEQGRLQSARNVLGLAPQPNTEREIDRVRAAYERLRASGALSAAELARAHVSMTEKIIAARNGADSLASKFALVREQLIKLAVASAGIAVAVKEAISFESAMSDVRKVVDFTTPQQFKELTADIKDMSRQIPVAMVDLAKIAEAGGQMGIASQDIKGFTDVTAKMSTAFKIGAESAGKDIGKLMNIFSLTVPETRLLGDAINHLGNNTNAVERDILNVMARVGGMSRLFGLANAETAALATAFLSLGRPPEIAATAINALLLTLQSANTKDEAFKASLQSIGFSAKQLAADIARKPQETLMRFLETLKVLDKQAQVETIAKLFGKEYADDIAILLTGLNKYKDALGLVGKESNYAGSMEKEFAERIKTSEAQLQLAKNALVEAGTNLGTAFLPVVVGAAKAVAFLAQGMASLVEEFPILSAAATTAVTAIAGFGALRMVWAVIRAGIVGLKAPLAALSAEATTAGTALAGFGALRMVWAGIQSGIVGLIAPLARLTAAAFAFTITPLGAALTAAGVAAYAFYKATESNIPPLLENASALAKNREETVGKVKSLEALKKTLAETALGTKEHTDAEEKLAEIIPNANLSVDERGRILAKVGSATKDNTLALHAYLIELKQNDTNTFAMQLETQAKAFVTAEKERAKYAEGLKKWFAIGTDEAENFGQTMLRLSFDGWFYRKYKESGAELRRQSDDAKKGLNALLAEAQKAGMSVEDLGAAMKKIHADPAAIQQAVSLYRGMTMEAERATVGLSGSMRDASKSAEELAQKIKDLSLKREVTAGNIANLEKQLAAEEKRLQQETLQARIRAAEQSVHATTQRIEHGIAEEKRLYQEIMTLEERKRTASMTTEEKIRSLAERTMTEQERDRSRAMEGYTRIMQARQILSQTKLSPEDAKWAEELARKAQDAYASIGSATSNIQDTRYAIEGVRLAGEVLTSIYDRQEITAAKAFANQARGTASLKQSLQSAGGEVSSLKRDLDAIQDHTIKRLELKAEVAQAYQSLSAINRQLADLKDKTVTVSVRHLEAKASGGMVGYAQGGRLPGYGGGDRVPALLEAGEFVVRKDRAEIFQNLLSVINSAPLDAVRKQLPGYARGGRVAMPDVPRLAFAAGGAVPQPSGLGAIQPSDVVQFNFSFNDAPPVALFGSRDRVRQLRDDFSMLQRGR
ncbi:MAG: phage tail tape measure protein [Magnetococcales bacterium]|nr:phage tail tape measure protein [Magnetococcales bacterium]